MASCRSLNVDAIIRGGLRRYTDQLGHLWSSLADYYVRSGLFERVSKIDQIVFAVIRRWWSLMMDCEYIT
jgi:hypothetical protein